MTLNDIKHAVATLSESERAELLDFIETLPLAPLTKEERVRRFQAFIDSVQETMTPEQIEEAVEAMNEDYIEPWNEEEWKF
ncbi:MAG: hypothetical protein JNL34_15520 [Anaerolineae bacterium]|nr:hypothetical protein [Anaerolineae bacterium]